MGGELEFLFLHGMLPLKDNAGNSSMGESSKDTNFDKVQAHSQEVEMRAASTSEATGPAQVLGVNYQGGLVVCLIKSQ